MAGESILFNVDIENQSRRDLKDMKIKLVQRLKLKSTRKTKTFFRVVSVVHYPKSVPGKTNEKWNSNLVIPSVCASSNGVSLIDINYLLIFNFAASGSTGTTVMTIPIHIGKIFIVKDFEKI